MSAILCFIGGMSVQLAAQNEDLNAKIKGLTTLYKDSNGHPLQRFKLYFAYFEKFVKQLCMYF